MTLDDILNAAPSVLDELTRELIHRADEAMRADTKSQLTACLQLGLRSASIMHGMARVLDLHTLDSYETLNRAAIEARDLLMHFRLNDKGTREKSATGSRARRTTHGKPTTRRLKSSLRDAAPWTSLSG